MDMIVRTTARPLTRADRRRLARDAQRHTAKAQRKLIADVITMSARNGHSTRLDDTRGVSRH